MNWQLLIVFSFIILAAVFVGRGILLKAKSFSPKNSCASDCGCETKN